MPHDKIACPSCGKRYRWKDEMAGRKVKCQCEAIFRLPTTPDGEPELVTPGIPPATPASSYPAPPVTGSITEKTGPLSDGYDLHDSHLGPAAGNAPGSAAPSAATGDPAVCPACNQPVKAGAILCVNCGYNLKSGARVQTKLGKAIDTDEAPALSSLPASRRRLNVDAVADDTEKEHHRQELLYPLIVFAVGVAFTLINAFVLMPIAQQAISDAWFGGATVTRMEIALSTLAIAGTRLVIQIPVMVVSIFIVARIFGSSYGSLFTALLKLAAIALVVAAVDDATYAAVMYITEGLGVMGMEWLVRFGLVYGTFLALGMWLLDMDQLEAFVMYLLTMFIPMIGVLFIAGMIAAMFA